MWQAFLTTGAANVRSTAVSPRFIGPGIVRRFVITEQLGALSVTIPGMLLQYSGEDSGQATNVARSPVPSGNMIVEATGDVTRDAQLFSRGTWRHFRADTASNNLQWDSDLHYLITLPEFFLKLSAFTGNTALTEELSMSVTLFEAVPEDLIPDLL